MLVSLPSQSRALTSALMRVGLGILLLSSEAALAQRNIYDNIPNTRTMLDGDKSVEGYRLTPDGRTILGPQLAPKSVLLREDEAARR
jgi:hypothetical protein